MDNNFNQMNNENNQMYNQVVYPNQGSYQNQGFAQTLANDVNSFDLTKTLIGAGAALVATILATVLWVFITGITGVFIYLLSVLVGFVGIFVYEKITKKVDIVGLVICLIFVLIAIYFGVRYGYIYYVSKEIDVTVKEAKAWFELCYQLDSEVKAEYIGLMAKSYIFSIIYAVAVLVKQFKK